MPFYLPSHIDQIDTVTQELLDSLFSDIFKTENQPDVMNRMKDTLSKPLILASQYNPRALVRLMNNVVLGKNIYIQLSHRYKLKNTGSLS